jgi:hypothetical protein
MIRPYVSKELQSWTILKYPVFYYAPLPKRASTISHYRFLSGKRVLSFPQDGTSTDPYGARLVSQPCVSGKYTNASLIKGTFGAKDYMFRCQFGGKNRVSDALLGLPPILKSNNGVQLLEKTRFFNSGFPHFWSHSAPMLRPIGKPRVNF